jgi:hypothetical protein
MEVNIVNLFALLADLDEGTLVFDVDDLDPANVEVFDAQDNHVGFINMIDMEFVPNR